MPYQSRCLPGRRLFGHAHTNWSRFRWLKISQPVLLARPTRGPGYRGTSCARLWEGSYGNSRWSRRMEFMQEGTEDWADQSLRSVIPSVFAIVVSADKVPTRFVPVASCIRVLTTSRGLSWQSVQTGGQTTSTWQGFCPRTIMLLAPHHLQQIRQ